MSSLHHHWATTSDDDGEQKPQKAPTEEKTVPVHAKEEGPAHIPVAPATVSRRPAAIVGILMVMALGSAYFMQDIPGFLGQVLNQDVIRITETGFDPLEVRVTAGTTIEWVNDQDIPHILASDELCSSSEGCMETQAIFPGEKGTFTVSADTSSGIYEYSSLSDGSLYGKIYVVGGDVELGLETDLASTTNIPDAPVTEEVAVVEETEVAVAETEVTPEEILPPETIEEPTPQTASVLSVEGEDTPNTTPIGSLPNLPRNPYALGAGRVHPFNTEGQPIAEVVAQQNTQTEEFHGGAPAYPRPFRQPSTGAGGLWAVLLSSLMILFVVTRKMLRVNSL